MFDDGLIVGGVTLIAGVLVLLGLFIVDVLVGGGVDFAIEIDVTVVVAVRTDELRNDEGGERRQIRRRHFRVSRWTKEGRELRLDRKLGFTRSSSVV